jgi:hypothetical protein
MGNWHLAMIVLGAVSAGATLYGLHKLCLWLESRGHLYYKHRRSSSSVAGAFVAMQHALEPQTQYIIEVADEKRHHSDEEAAGEDTGARESS